MEVTRHRGQLGATEIIARDEVAEERLVAELLAEIEILLPLAEQVAARGRELVVEQDIMVFAVEAAGLDVLIGDARRDLEFGGRLEQQRRAAADAAAIVDMLLAERPDRIDESAVVGAITDHPERRRRRQRKIDGALQPITDVAALEDIGVSLNCAFGTVELGLIGDVADSAADAAGAE